MTIIVAAVLLLTAALTLITVFGSQITSFVGAGEGTVSSAEVEVRCNQIKERIQTGICDAAAQDSELTSSYDNPNDGGAKFSLGDDSRSISVMVDTENGQANCVTQGYIPETCPVVQE